jgi:hypothetical protein
MSSRPICETPSKLVPANGAPLSVLILAILPIAASQSRKGLDIVQPAQEKSSAKKNSAA